MRRRKFIWLSATGVVMSTLPWLGSCTSPSKWITILARPSVLGNFCDQQELMEMGKTYVARFPEEATISVLDNRLMLDDDSSSAYKPSSEEALREFIGRKIDRDFAMEQTLIIEGWVIAQTEARQCALYFLTQNS